MAQKSNSLPASKNNAALTYHKNKLILNFSRRNFIFYTTNFIFSLRNWKYNKGIFECNKDVSWFPYCILEQNKGKNDFLGEKNGGLWAVEPVLKEKNDSVASFFGCEASACELEGESCLSNNNTENKKAVTCLCDWLT